MNRRSEALLRRGAVGVIVFVTAVIAWRMFLGSHYAVTVHNAGPSRLEAVVTFPEGTSRSMTLPAGAERCTSFWVDRDGAIVVRVGVNEDSMYVSSDLGEDLMVNVTSGAVQFLKSARTRIPWRHCW